MLLALMFSQWGTVFALIKKDPCMIFAAKHIYIKVFIQKGILQYIFNQPNKILWLNPFLWEMAKSRGAIKKPLKSLHFVLS